MASRRAQKDQRKAERLAREAAKREAAKRKQRITIIGVALASLAVLAVALVIISGSDKDSGSGLKGVDKVNRSLLGIDQKGSSIGSAKAPVTIVEFADLQCPFCRDFSNKVLPQLIDSYVKTGKVRMQLKLLSFIGPDSERAARYASFAGQSGRMWNFSEIFYENQGAEGSGYVTTSFLNNVSKASGVTPLPTGAELQSPQVDAALKEASDQAEKEGITATPSFLIGKSGGPLRRLDSKDYNFSTFQAEIEALLR